MARVRESEQIAVPHQNSRSQHMKTIVSILLVTCLCVGIGYSQEKARERTCTEGIFTFKAPPKSADDNSPAPVPQGPHSAGGNRTNAKQEPEPRTAVGTRASKPSPLVQHACPLGFDKSASTVAVVTDEGEVLDIRGSATTVIVRIPERHVRLVRYRSGSRFVAWAYSGSPTFTVYDTESRTSKTVEIPSFAKSQTDICNMSVVYKDLTAQDSDSKRATFVSDLLISPGERFIFVGSLQHLFVFTLPGLEVVRDVQKGPEGFTELAANADGTMLLARGASEVSREGSISFGGPWLGYSSLLCIPIPKGELGQPNSFDFSSQHVGAIAAPTSGDRFALVGREDGAADWRVMLWTAGKQSWKADLRAGPPVAIAFTPNDSYLIGVFPDGTVTKWRVDDGTPSSGAMTTDHLQTAKVHHAVLSADCTKVAVSLGEAREVFVFEPPLLKRDR